MIPTGNTYLDRIDRSHIVIGGFFMSEHDERKLDATSLSRRKFMKKTGIAVGVLLSVEH